MLLPNRNSSVWIIFFFTVKLIQILTSLYGCVSFCNQLEECITAVYFVILAVLKIIATVIRMVTPRPFQHGLGIICITGFVNGCIDNKLR